jgi:hypothetical protein
MKTLSSFVLLFCFAAIASAQERVIDKAEFDAMVTGGHDHKVKWKGEKYRLTVTTSSKATCRPTTDFSSKMITEFGPSMETRTINTSTFGGKPSTGREMLRIGNWVYTRSGDDSWSRKEFVATTPPKTAEESPHKVLSSEAEHRYLGQSTLQNKPVHIYVKTEQRTTLNEKTGETTESESKNTYWVDAKGMVLKNEYKSDNRSKHTNQTYVLLEWELDPSITFTAPEITP